MARNTPLESKVATRSIESRSAGCASVVNVIMDRPALVVILYPPKRVNGSLRKVKRLLRKKILHEDQKSAVGSKGLFMILLCSKRSWRFTACSLAAGVVTKPDSTDS